MVGKGYGGQNPLEASVGKWFLPLRALAISFGAEFCRSRNSWVVLTRAFFGICACGPTPGLWSSPGYQ